MAFNAKKAKGTTAREKYAIVSFVNEKRKGKQVIELVPSSWLSSYSKGQGNICQCFYPAEGDTRVRKMIENCKPPSSTWQLYDAEIRKMATNYNQGLRRLKRACLNIDVESSALSGESTAEVDVSESEESSDDDELGDVSSTTSSPKPATKTSELVISEGPTDDACSQILDDAEIEMRASRNNEPDDSRQKKKRKREIELEAKSPEGSAENKLLKGIYEKLDVVQLALSKQIKSAKLSILHDLTSKVAGLKNTIVLNQPSDCGNTLKECKKTLGVSLPIKDYDSFILFDAEINPDKEKALKQIMVESAGASKHVKDAVRRILGDLIMKAVQEMYSGTGKKGPNGVTKKNFSGTNVYACMKDVIVEKLEVDKAAVLSATSRYLSGAGDREGGKARRDAAKKATE